MLPQAYIKNLDLEYLEKRLTDRYKWPSENASEAVRRYKNFLLLLLKYPNEVLAPTPDIDEAWHNHILFTREYMRDCQAIFGNYLHHAPSRNSPEEKKVMLEAQSRSSDLYIQEFNEPYLLELDIAAFW
ncbi:MAG: glycine-rich domain-containing protein-like [Rhabdochlamydiaceae bacterium]|nr:glycine-rich domain-containing protein-like [Rhabdochlamydiaceae bacterium]